MARTPRTPDSLRQHVVTLLDGGRAHARAVDVLRGFPADRCGERPRGMAHSGWQLVEHVRIAQRDMLDWCRTAPGASNDPGAVDLATAMLVTASPEGVPLSLAGTTTPVLGANWQLQANGLPAATAFGLTVIGLSDAGLNDLASIGMPGCDLRASLDILAPFAVPAGTPSYSWSIAIPANAPLGFPIYTTTVVAPAPATNALGLITSNGIRGLVNGF